MESKPGSHDYEIVGQAVPLDGEPVFSKQHYDSFSNPELPAYLKDNGITAVILVGGFMPRCVLGTAYGANNWDLHVLVLEDLVFEPVEFQTDRAGSLGVVRAILGYVDNSATLLQNWAS
jgi:nicotinamidase-related amidase